MTAREWKTVSQLFTKAAALDPSLRGAFLSKACGNKPALKREIESLLVQHDRPGPFLGVYSSIGEQILSHYRILDQLGGGGMGVVYKAEDLRLGRVVAIKALLPWVMGDPRWRERLRQEARSASSLNHPNIVTIYEVAEDRGIDFIVMEYLSGQTLDRLIDLRGLPVSRALRLALQIGTALSAAHAAGIMHGDLKPSNIMVMGRDRVKLLDFGLVRRPGDKPLARQFGTVAYMAPEQRDGTACADPRSEIFSFGLVLSEMLHGRRAFRSIAEEEIESAETRSLDAFPLKVPTSVQHTILRCLEKAPSGRFQSMAHVVRSLESLGLHQRGSELAEAAGAGRGSRWTRGSGEQIKSLARRISYDRLAESTRVLSEIGHLLKTGASPAARQAVLAALRDFILTSPATDGGGVPASSRELRKKTLELIKTTANANLRSYFEANDFEHLDLYGMDFGGAQLAGMGFRGSFLVEACFKSGVLAKASFAGAWIRNVDFAGADLTDVDFNDADWFNALHLTEFQLGRSRCATLAECPRGPKEMHEYLRNHYGFPFESWPARVREELEAAWAEYWRDGLCKTVSRWRHELRDVR